MIRTFLTVAAFCAVLPAAVRGDDAKDGWVELLGNDLTKNFVTKGNWSLKDGVVTLTPRPGEKDWKRYDMYLWYTKAPITDFDCKFEYKFQKGGNSGFYFHVKDMMDPVTTGIEVQLYESGDKPKNAKLTDHDSGGVIPGIPPKKNAAKPVGEWNEMLVSVRGELLVISLNGEEVNRVTISDQPRLKDRPKTGSIGFQDHGLPMSLRKIQVKVVK